VKLLLDTDVLIDIAIDRQPFSKSAATLIDHLQRTHNSEVSAFVSWSSFLEFSQHAAPVVGNHKTAEFCNELCSFLKVAPTRSQHLSAALAFNLPDFRATLQVAAAVSCSADVLVSSHNHQYQGIRIPVKSPAVLIDGGLG
jgi:predicted nucleic acid-binding protein